MNENEIIEPVMSYNSSQTTSTPTAPVASRFDGNVLGYIGLTLLTALITIVTFGLLTPLAICMWYNWEISHTIIGGRRLKFTGTAMGLFGNWLKWWFFTMITFGIYGLWVTVKVLQWKAKHTVFAD